MFDGHALDRDHPAGTGSSAPVRGEGGPSAVHATRRPDQAQRSRRWFVALAISCLVLLVLPLSMLHSFWSVRSSSAAHSSYTRRSSSRPLSLPRNTVRAHVAGSPCPTALRVPQHVPGSTGWVPIGRLVSGCSALYKTQLGAVSIVWMDPRLLSFTLYSGSLIPGGGPYLKTAPISAADALNLVAAFNSGFRDGDSHGGYFVQGRAEIPLVDGIASAVIYTDGTMQIATWGSEVSMTPNVVAVRQNMTLLIDRGVINPATSSEPYSSWGVTWPGGARTNRSALGVTADGAELFAEGWA
jgi:hypothetical protein